MKPCNLLLKMKSSNDNFVNTSLSVSDELCDSENFNYESVDPLRELSKDNSQPKCHRVDSIVFAEPLKNISNEETTTKDKHEEEDIIFIDNVVVQKGNGRKYKKYHMNIEDPSNLRCPQPNCSRTFTMTKLLKAHIRKVHCADKHAYMCERCGQGFYAQYLLDRHSTVHSGKRVECHVCGVTLSCRTGLTSHLRCHSFSRPHQCVICSKSFKRPSTLATHVKFVHRQGVLECQHCGMSFASRKQWSQHMATHRTKKSIEATSSHGT